MVSTLRLLAAVMLLGSLFGCANWSPNVNPEAPGIYSDQPADG